MQSINNRPDITLVSDNQMLERLCAKWRDAPVLALDTEFIRTDTFFPIPALLQVYDGQACHLLDLTALTNYAPLCDILNNQAIVKVLHSCSEDLEIFDVLFKTLPHPLFDTQIAAAFLGYGFSVGYSRLTKTLFDVELPKDESRSNWLQRPLTNDQIEYAAMDVIYLYQLYLNFAEALNDSDKKIWVTHCNNELIEHYRENQQPEHYFNRIKNTWRLTPEQQVTLYQLCLWRESEARRRNKPRNRIMRDEIMFEHAQAGTQPQHCISTNIADIKVPTVAQPLPRESGELVKQLKSAVDQKSQELNVAPEMLVRKKDITAFVCSGYFNQEFQLPDSLSGWRKSIIGPTFNTISEAWQTKKIPTI